LETKEELKYLLEEELKSLLDELKMEEELKSLLKEELKLLLLEEELKSLLEEEEFKLLLEEEEEMLKWGLLAAAGPVDWACLICGCAWRWVAPRWAVGDPRDAMRWPIR